MKSHGKSFWNGVLSGLLGAVVSGVSFGFGAQAGNAIGFGLCTAFTIYCTTLNTETRGK